MSQSVVTNDQLLPRSTEAPRLTHETNSPNADRVYIGLDNWVQSEEPNIFSV